MLDSTQSSPFETYELSKTLLLINTYIDAEKYEITQLPNILYIISNINSIGFLEFNYEQIKNKIEILIHEHLELRNRVDYHILESAFAAKVDYLITENKNLLKIKNFNVITPDEYLLLGRMKIVPSY
ncbi:toxin-antitoxin system, toxin component [Leptospira noguchii]|uniref:toxin-antitoxin system, toxin component n=1 Tax=Leptospira noguchii TaxID=28182 RepID=UPI000A502B3D|nr:toxin-antitoxin system, toxin component [Leptospira noguchii]